MASIETKGRYFNYFFSRRHDYITTYYLTYSLDGNVFDYVTQQSGTGDTQPILFDGNTDGTTIVSHTFTERIDARFVRLLPQTCVETMSLRWELYGCDGELMTSMLRRECEKWRSIRNVFL